MNAHNHTFPQIDTAHIPAADIAADLATVPMATQPEAISADTYRRADGKVRFHVTATWCGVEHDGTGHSLRWAIMSAHTNMCMAKLSARADHLASPLVDDFLTIAAGQRAYVRGVA